MIRPFRTLFNRVPQVTDEEHELRAWVILLPVLSLWILGGLIIYAWYTKGGIN